MNSAHGRQQMVSCLMVTLPVPYRFEYFKRSVADYRRQTHPSRELVVVMDRGTPEGREAIRGFVRDQACPDIRVIEPAETLTLGALRNISLDAARGDVLCQWDDDDRYHPERIERQLSALETSNSLSVCLREVMQFLPNSRRLYLTNWSATPPTMKPPSLMCLKQADIRYPETGPEARLGEDLAVLFQLQARGACHALAGAPHLYVYTSHGQNTCDEDHHRMLVDRLSVSLGIVRRREAALREGLSAFDFGPGEVAVHGANGLAFTIP